MSQDHRIILTTKQLKRLPGRSSQLSSTRLRGMIEGLLVEAGIDTRAWATKGGRDILAFEIVERSGDGDVKVFHFKFEVPRIHVKQKRGTKYLESTSWRFFHDYMEHRLYAVILGFDSVVTEFTDHLVMMLPDGREQMVRERITEAIKKGEQEALPFIRREVEG